MKSDLAHDSPCLEIVADDPAEGPLEGERFGKYLLVGEVATGGMADVYLGVQSGVQGYLKVVTIKRVLDRLNASPEYTAMFVNEGRLAARLEHANIVRTYEFGEHDNQYYTAMEYLPGEELTRLLNHSASRHSLPLNLAVHIIMQVCAGLHFAHELTDVSGEPLGLVHRDVNPSNIIVTYNGEVKLIDFGVAKSTNNHQTVAGTIKGKLAYMSPEQVLGHTLDRRSDVFSVGVVLWELLTSRPLFARENEAATLYAIMNDTVPSARQFRPDIPRDLDAMVARALARSPQDRFESCEVMSLALETFLGTQPKVDVRTVARTMEEMFGAPRANAKRSIAQTRSLRSNISLVMKLRTEVRQEIGVGARPSERTAEAPPARAWGLIAVVLVAVLALAGGLVFMATRGADTEVPAARPPARASLKLESVPSGAAIFLGDEPTGRKTPATFDIAPGKVSFRLELDAHTPAAESLAVEPGQVAERRVTLTRRVAKAPTFGRLVLAGLPSTAEIWVDGVEQLVGEVVPVVSGTHEVRIDVDGKPLLKQRLETSSGDQVWELKADRLVRR